MPAPDPERFVTPRQRAIHASFMRTRSQSETARELSVSQIRVREALVQRERNLIRARGEHPPSLKRMQEGDVTTRYGIARDIRNGRPAKHPRAVTEQIDKRRANSCLAEATTTARIDRPLIVTGIDAGSPVHPGFLHNLRAYAAHLGAELRIYRVGDARRGSQDLAEAVADAPIGVGDALEIRSDIPLPRFARYPLDGLQRVAPSGSAILIHGTPQLESLPRVAALPPRFQVTTGLASASRRVIGHRVVDELELLGAVVIEPGTDGRAGLRRISTHADRDGAFHDLDRRVADGRVAERVRVEAIVAGDVHHPLTDPGVVAATWGPGGLVDRLRPRHQVLHDVADFHARNHHDARDHHVRFARFVAGRDDVRAELEGVSRFLAFTRRPGCTVHVVASNHDRALTRWLRDSDHRTDPLNAEFQIECERLVLARIRAGRDAGIMPEVLRSFAADRLDGVEFVAEGQTLMLAGIEHGLHGDRGSDGQRGAVSQLESMGIDMTVGHFHRPAIRGGVYVAGLCSPALGYERGPTRRAMGHVIQHVDGTRQHVLSAGCV